MKHYPYDFATENGGYYRPSYTRNRVGWLLYGITVALAVGACVVARFS
jgi:hypothetical protein